MHTCVYIMKMSVLRFVFALAVGASARAARAAAGASFFAAECTHQPTDGEPHGRRHDDQCYDGL